MRVWLIEASPSDAATGETVPVRLAGGGSGRPFNYRDFKDWKAGVVELPRFTTSLDFGDAGWTGGAVPQTAALTFRSHTPSIAEGLAALFWKDADLTVYLGDDAALQPEFEVVLAARVAASELTDGALTLTIADLGQKLNKPILAGQFAGTGGTEGAAAAIGRPKRRSFGRVFNVEGRILDPVNLIYEFGDTGRRLQAIDNVRDKGREGGALIVVPWQGSAAATLAALVAATPEKGGGAVAPTIACVKWWTTAAGPLTADITGDAGDGLGGAYVETAPEIAAMIARIAGVTSANVAAAKAARPDPVGIHCDDESETFAGAIDRLLVGSSLLWVLNPSGTIRFETWSLDSSIATGEPEEIVSQSVSRKALYSPIKGRRLGYQANSRVMNPGEISAAIPADELFYPDGTRVSELQPFEPGATVGAPDGTPVGSMLAEDVVGRIVQFTSGLKSAEEEIAAVKDRVGDAEDAISGVDDLANDLWARLGTLPPGATVAERIQTLSTSVGSSNARITTLEQTGGTATQAVAQRVSSLETNVGTTNTRISNVEQTAANATSAVAQRVSTLETNVGGPGGLSARLTTTEQVAATAFDRVTGARWSKEAVAGNGRAQLTVYAYDNNGNLTSGVDIIGDLTIKGNLLVDGTIQTTKVAPNAITSVTYAQGGTYNVPVNSFDDISVLSINALGGPILFSGSADIGADNSSAAWEFDLRIYNNFGSLLANSYYSFDGGSTFTVRANVELAAGIPAGQNTFYLHYAPRLQGGRATNVRFSATQLKR